MAQTVELMEGKLLVFMPLLLDREAVDTSLVCGWVSPLIEEELWLSSMTSLMR